MLPGDVAAGHVKVCPVNNGGKLINTENIWYNTKFIGNAETSKIHDNGVR